MFNFEYTVIRKPWRRTLSINISPENKVVVKTSKTLSRKKIENFIKKSLKWINKRLEFNKKNRKPYVPKKFEENEDFFYLGEKYPLVINEGRGKDIELKDNKFCVYAPAKSKNRGGYIEKKFIRWYKNTAYKIFSERIMIYKSILKVSVSALEIKSLSQTWGSCSKKKVISLGWKLVMAPVHIIDYIILHELCHLIHLNHSASFWKQVETVIPDYKQYKKWLVIHENLLRF